MEGNESEKREGKNAITKTQILVQSPRKFFLIKVMLSYFLRNADLIQGHLDGLTALVPAILRWCVMWDISSPLSFI